MAGVLVLAADGFETIECLTVVDVLRRGGVRTTLASIMATREVMTAQQIPVTCDCVLDEVDLSEYSHIVLPGGLPGTTHLRNDERVCAAVRDFAATKHVAAICAAPSVLAELGLLEGRRATCYPGFERDFPEGTYAGGRTVIKDGNLITASGMGVALPFSLAILEDVAGTTAAEKVADSIQMPRA